MWIFWFFFFLFLLLLSLRMAPKKGIVRATGRLSPSVSKLLPRGTNPCRWWQFGATQGLEIFHQTSINVIIGAQYIVAWYRVISIIYFR